MWFPLSLSPIKPISSGFCSGFNLTLFHLAFYGLVATIFELCYTTKWICDETKKVLFFLNSSVHERLYLPFWRSILWWISLISVLEVLWTCLHHGYRWKLSLSCIWRCSRDSYLSSAIRHGVMMGFLFHRVSGSMCISGSGKLIRA